MYKCNGSSNSLEIIKRIRFAIILVISVFLPRKFRVSGDVDAVKFAIRVKRAYVRPDVRALPQVVLAIRALESLQYAALVSVMSHHVTAVLITAVAIRARVTVKRGLLAAAGAL